MPDSLPAHVAAPSQAQIEHMLAAAANTLGDLIESGTAPNTRRALQSALRYWSAWHLACFGVELPLLRTPRATVPASTVLLFIAHHAPVIGSGGVVDIGMPGYVRERLAQIMEATLGGRTGTRQVAQRRGPGRISEQVPALATVEQRIAMLCALHTRAGLFPPTKTDPQINATLRALRRDYAAKAPQALTEHPEAITSDLFREALDTLPPTPDGLRDRALLLLSFLGGGRRRSEVMGARIEDFTLPATDDARLRGADAKPGWGRWRLFQMKGRVASTSSGVLASLPLPPVAVSALRAWLGVLASHGIHTGPLWRRMTHGRGRRPLNATPDTLKPGAPLPDSELLALVKRVAVAAGWDTSLPYHAHSLRHGFVTQAAMDGVAPEVLIELTGHTTTRQLSATYDHHKRTSEAQSAVAGMADALNAKKPREQ